MTHLNYKKIFALGVIAVIFAIIGWALPITTTNESVFQTEVNNTNLAPTIDITIPGTGERLNNSTYWANTTEIELHVFAHANSVSQTARVFLYINDTLVSPRSGRPLGAAEEAYRGIDTRIPRGSYYRVLFTNYHHYEWREYRVISGQNGSVNISNVYNNITNISGGGNVTQADLDLKVNISGSAWTGNMIMDGTTITTNTTADKDAYIYMDSALPTVRMRSRNNGTAGYFELFPYYSDILVSGRRYNFTNTSLDISNSSLINVSGYNVTPSGPYNFNIQSVYDNNPTRMYLIPKGNVSSGLVSGIKLFGTDYINDTSNYDDFGIYNSLDGLHFNSKKLGTGQDKDFIFSSQDTENILTIAKNSSILHSNASSVSLRSSLPIYGLQNVERGVTPENSTVITNRKDSVTATFGNVSAYFLARSVDTDIEFLMGTSSSGYTFSGSSTNSNYALRTNNNNRIIMNTTAGIQIPELTANLAVCTNSVTALYSCDLQTQITNNANNIATNTADIAALQTKTYALSIGNDSTNLAATNRSLNTVYWNNFTRPIKVSVYVSQTNSNTGWSDSLFTINGDGTYGHGLITGACYNNLQQNFTYRCGYDTFVPSGSNYSVPTRSTGSSTSASLIYWFENAVTVQ